MAYTNPGPAVATTIHPQSVTSNQAIRLLGVATGVNLSATGDAVAPLMGYSDNMHDLNPYGSSESDY